MQRTVWRYAALSFSTKTRSRAVGAGAMVRGEESSPLGPQLLLSLPQCPAGGDLRRLDVPGYGFGMPSDCQSSAP